MKALLFSLIFLSFAAKAQQEYFTPQVKAAGIDYFKKQIFAGCKSSNQYLEAMKPSELKKLKTQILEIVTNNFSQAFAENPEIKEGFVKDLNEIENDPACQRDLNQCRVRLMSLSMYYYQQFRADLPACKADNTLPDCASETRFRKSSFEGVHSTHYGATGIGKYKQQLLEAKNQTTKKLFNLILRKNEREFYICYTSLRGDSYHYQLDMEEPGGYYANLEADYYPGKNLPKDCVDEKKVLHQEFIRTSIGDDRFKVGLDEAEPVRKSLTDFIKANSDIIISDIDVSANVAQIPSYVSLNGKQVIDPKSNEKNLSAAKERAEFVQKIFEDLKKSYSYLEKVNLKASGALAGPDFHPTDLNERFVTHMTPDYLDRVNATFTKNKKMYNEVALMTTSEELTQESKFSNLFQAKYKPFQGYKVIVKGYRKDEMKCLSKDQKSARGSKASKQ